MAQTAAERALDFAVIGVAQVVNNNLIDIAHALRAAGMDNVADELNEAMIAWRDASYAVCRQSSMGAVDAKLIDAA